MEPVAIARSIPSSAREARKSAAVDDGSVAGSHALVAVGPVAMSEGVKFAYRRPQPAFLAHLVAMKQRVPQTRAGRRADPAEAAAVYNTALSIPESSGLTVRRSI